jgi:hypothetical protein
VRRTISESLAGEYRRDHAVGMDAPRQLGDADRGQTFGAGSNAIAVMIAHIAGTRRSRYTDFVNREGEKPWRKGNREFASDPVTQTAVQAGSESSWSTAFVTRSPLWASDLTHPSQNRGPALSVVDASTGRSPTLPTMSGKSLIRPKPSAAPSGGFREFLRGKRRQRTANAFESTGSSPSCA